MKGVPKDNPIKALLRKSKVVVALFQAVKRLVVLPLKLTPLRPLQLEKMPLRDLFLLRKLRLLCSVAPYTKGGYPRQSHIYHLARDVERAGIPGSFVECGTWKGGLSAIMAAIAHRYGDRRTTWYLDSFEGMPSPSEKDGNDTAEIEGDVLKASVADVEELVFGKLKLPKEKNRIVKGWFQDTIPRVKKEIGPIAILRMDADWYEATKFCIEELYEQVIPGGYLVFDDYGRWEGCRKAVEEFVAERKLAVKFQYIGTYGARVMYFKKQPRVTNPKENKQDGSVSLF